MAQVAPLVNALVELMTAKDALSAKMNEKGIVFNATHQKEVQDLQNKVAAAQTKVNQTAQQLQADLDQGLVRP